MLKILMQIENIREEMDRLTALILHQGKPLHASRHYPKLLRLSQRLDLYYKELSLVNPELYFRIVEANTTRCDIVRQVTEERRRK
ncbi:hypothetical protein [Clostridium sp. D33t1_170424_F3]|uniref:hypothetical protein n=1 Tax=Clostridium sp. D33t1_170424_F3 TaxID=2787099 RepID=UPI0018ABA2B8|nr:hypothetical protein [Clostridium sp. D33t1_170424_F3]